jgi:Bacterial PH domain
MSDNRTVRVTVIGDRSGDYVVVEERPDGSLVLAPDSSRGRTRSRRRGLTGFSLSRLLTRHGSAPATVHEALDGWGLELAEDEFVTSFLEASVDGRTGFAAVTNRRVVFFARSGAELRAIDEHPLSDVLEVELVRRPFKSVLRVRCEESETEIAGALDALQRLRHQLGAG